MGNELRGRHPKVAFGEITAHEIKSETAKTVTLANGKRERKCGAFSDWHDTWEAAHAHMVDQAERRVDSLRLGLESAINRLDRIKGMKPPKE